MRIVHTQIPDKATGNKKPSYVEIPPFTRIGEGRIAVSGKWSPPKSVSIVKIKFSCSYTTGSSTFKVLKGNNNAAVDTSSTESILYQGGAVVASIESSASYSEVDVAINLAPGEWLAVGEFVVNPCTNPVIVFVAQEDLTL